MKERIRDIRGISILIIITLFAILFISTRGSDKIIGLVRHEFVAGEVIDVTVSSADLEGFQVDIVSPGAVYKFLTPAKSLKYRASSSGTYKINVYRDGIFLETENFTVTSDGAEIRYGSIGLIKVAKENLTIGEDAILILDNSALKENYRLVISNEKNRYNYLSLTAERIRFSPKSVGRYSAELYEGDNLVASALFFVIQKEVSQNSVDQSSLDNSDGTGLSIPEDSFEDGYSLDENLSFITPDFMPFKVVNNRRFFSYADVKIKRKYTQNESVLLKTPLKTTTFSQMRLEKGRYDIDIYPDFADVKSVNLSGVLYDGDFEFGLEEVPVEQVKVPGSVIKKAFAIDPSMLNFTSGIIDVTAKGRELLKCADWNFLNQSCNGDWVFVQYIVPGEDYSLIINSTDPGFAEAGLASINTQKPVYHNNESVKLMIVVLDNEGYLSARANVTLDIELPDSTIRSFSTDALDITEVKTGIYEIYFNETLQDGRYGLTVYASGENVNNTMRSYFDVTPYYEFEIARNVPIVLDPFKGMLLGSITISSYSGIENFSYTEYLPGSFTIEENFGAEVILKNNTYSLTWHNLSSNSTVSYRARLPPISPALYEISGEIIYGDFSSYYENRPWFIAADPSTNYLVQTSSCAGWPFNGALCGGTYGYSSASGSDVNHTCTFTDTIPANAVIQSVNVTVLNVISSCDSTNINVALNNEIMGSIPAGACDCTSDGAQTFTLSNLSLFNIGGTNTVNLDPLGASRRAIADVSGNFLRLNISYTLRPNITLRVPSDGNTTGRGRVYFNFTPFDDDSTTIKNCTLYGNFGGGAFLPNATLVNIANNTNVSINISLSPGTYIWGVQCYDANNVLGYSVNRTLYVTKRIDMFYPDRAAPGMSIVVNIIGEDFNSTETVQTNSTDVIVGPIVVTNRTGFVVNSSGSVIQVPLFIKSTAAAQNVTLNVSRGIANRTFDIVIPSANSGNFTGLSGIMLLGNGGRNGTRSFYGTIVLDKLIIPSGVTVNIYSGDPDGIISNGNQGFLPAIIVVAGQANISGLLNVSGASGVASTTDAGGNGGNGGVGGGAGGGGGADDTAGGQGGQMFLTR